MVMGIDRLIKGLMSWRGEHLGGRPWDLDEGKGVPVHCQHLNYLPNQYSK